MRIGLISFAHVHAASYAGVLKSLPGVEFVGIYDEVRARGRAEAQRYEVRWFDRLEGLLEASEAVVVSSTNADHHRYVLAAAASGRHVLCEKPLATRIEDAEEMVRKCRDAGVLLMTAFPMRFSPPVVSARRAVEMGGVGEIRAFTGSNNGKMPGGWFSDPQLAGGGALMDHVVHLADLMRWFLGTDPVQVYAEADALLHPGIQVEDVGMVALHFPNGVIGTIDASWSRPERYPTWGGLRFRIIGTDGALEVDAFSQQSQVYSDRAPDPWWAFWGSDVDRAMIAAFVAAVQRRIPVPVTGEDGLAALRIAVAARRSAASGEPVALASLSTGRS